ncbi:hypothetical protein [uncultured Microbacterium sp.]|uniref:hypothetical protein n=1 Tax=uncultured Microbacterium sp. TaxID=191216 RepID=UPI0028E4F1FB|nr:hypothetical protein [uncultured Microbacterium sp.]
MSKKTDREAARDTFENLVARLGKPKSGKVTESDEIGFSDFATWIKFDQMSTFHPVFAFAHHFHSADDYERGYTENSYRGDHISIPGYTEMGNIGIIEISFHKGNTAITQLTFEPPTDENEHSPVLKAWKGFHDGALALLEEYETR